MEAAMNVPAPADSVVRATWISLGAALALITLGALAALLPYAVGVAVGMLVVWVVVFSGLAHLVHAWDVRGELFLWRLLVGLVYLCGGLYLVLTPDFSMSALVRFIGAMFLLEAGLLLASAWWMRGRRGSGLLVLDGCGTSLFAALIFALGDWSPPWLFGLLVGVNVLASGLVFLALLRDEGLSTWRVAA
jgi:uncharacterized membrane protein HdeD (DUF308 family)